MLGAFLKAGINEFEISIKFCVFLIPILIFFKKKNVWVIIALFAILKCKCEKNCTFSNILQKVKSYFFANVYHSPCDSYWNSKKSIKLKPPTVHSCVCFRKFLIFIFAIRVFFRAPHGAYILYWQNLSFFDNIGMKFISQISLCSTIFTPAFSSCYGIYFCQSFLP